ncbi:MAG TPA: alanine racemase [Caulobacteraceae bacterium]
MSAGEARLSVDLDALADNFTTLRDEAASAEVAPVVKADGYGLGAGPVAHRLWAEGARRFFVARVGEGERVRAALGPHRPAEIYVLDGAPPGALPRLVEAGLTPVLNTLAQVGEASAFSGRRQRLAVALHIDTGLNRLGLRIEEAEALARAPQRLAGLELGLVMSHLACGPSPDHPMNRRQLDLFRQGAALFPDARRSLANSAGIFLGPDYHFDVVRPGVTLYGGGPRERHDPRIAAVAALEAPILQVRDVPPGESIGYDASFTAERPMRVAIVPLGHADGVLRSLAGKGFAWLDGARRPMLGCISMDLVAVDVTGCDAAQPGAMVELLGPHALVDEVAAAAGTISYEVLVRLSSRAERVYVGVAG